MAAEARGWSVIVVVLRDSRWENRLRELYPKAMIRGSEDIQSLGCKLNVLVWFCDVEPPRGMRIFGDTADGQVTVVSLRRFRQVIPQGYMYQNLRLRHEDCGGVTDGEWPIHVYRRGVDPLMERPRPVAGRDLYSLVDTTTHGYVCQPPAKVVTNKPRVIQLQPTTYHIGGLFPMHKKDARFVVPSVFSTMGWVRRKLTGFEMCQVFDVPSEVCHRLTSKEVSVLCKTPFLPLKIAAKVLEVVDLARGLKRATSLDLKREGTKRTRIGKAEADLTQAPMVTSMEAELERKLRAVKSDDAAVPEYLWDLILVPDGDQAKTAKLSHLRGFILCWLKRNFRREFIRWFYVKYPKLAKRLVGLCKSDY